jgi:hypothetical protein
VWIGLLLFSYRFMETVPAQLARRGFTVKPPGSDRVGWGTFSDELPGFLYRDYALPLWYLMHEYVHDVLDKEFGNTPEERNQYFRRNGQVQSWLHELFDESAAGIHYNGKIASYDAMVDLITQIIFQGSAQHSAVNFGQSVLGEIP